jgi:hypothetical protein
MPVLSAHGLIGLHILLRPHSWDGPLLIPGTVVALTLNGAPWRGLCAALLVVAVLGLAGCGRGQGYDASLPTASTVSTARAGASTATTRAGDGKTDAKAAILADYRAYWDALVAAGAHADAKSQLLAEHASGTALAQAQAHFEELKRLGQVDRGTVALHPEVIGILPVSAAVRDCPDTSRWQRRDARTGALRESPDEGGRAEILALMSLIDGTWKVTHVTGKGPCED